VTRLTLTKIGKEDRLRFRSTPWHRRATAERCPRRAPITVLAGIQ